jgi:hypothetical protein
VCYTFVAAFGEQGSVGGWDVCVHMEILGLLHKGLANFGHTRKQTYKKKRTLQIEKKNAMGSRSGVLVDPVVLHDYPQFKTQSVSNPNCTHPLGVHGWPLQPRCPQRPSQCPCHSWKFGTSCNTHQDPPPAGCPNEIHVP